MERLVWKPVGQMYEQQQKKNLLKLSGVNEPSVLLVNISRC